MIHTSLAPAMPSFPDTDLYSFLFEYFPPERPDTRTSSQPLLIDEETGQGWSFAQVKERVDLLSLALQHLLGIQWDDRVGIFSANSVEVPIAIWATQRLGGVVSAANPAFNAAELVYQLKAANATVLFLGSDDATIKVGLEVAQKLGFPKDKIVVMHDPQTVFKYAEGNYGRVQKRTSGMWTLAGLVEQGRQILQRKGPSCLDRRTLQPGESRTKLALLSFSSGTTGLPKGVAIQHSAPISNILQFQAFNEVPSELGQPHGRFRPGVDTSLGVLPQFHIYGLVVGLHATFYLGVPNVVLPRFRGIEAMIKTILRYRISVWWLVPPQVVLLCKDPSVPPYVEQLRKVVNFVMVGAAPLSDDLSRQFARLLPNVDFGQGYGMTETSTVTIMHPPGMPAVLGSCGRLFSSTEARIVDAHGHDCGTDTPGELWIRGPQNTLGYFNNATATAEMFVADNWVRTGDEVVVNRAGDYFIVDRLKELIKVKGFQVAPAELEGCILNQDGVADVGVIGVPDEENGECPLAFVVWKHEVRERLRSGAVREEALIGEVVEFVRREKVRYKWLGGVVVLDAIPKTASGKILRRNMREMAKSLDESVTKKFKHRREGKV